MNDSVNVSERYRQAPKFEGIVVEKPQRTPLNYESAVQFAEKLNVPIVDSAQQLTGASKVDVITLGKSKLDSNTDSKPPVVAGPHGLTFNLTAIDSVTRITDSQ